MDNEQQEKKTEEGEKEGTDADTKDGDKYETTPVIERAREEREKLEVALKAQKEENDRTERIMAKQALGGKSEAGQEPEKKPEETDEEFAKRLEKGEVEIDDFLK